MNKFGENLQYYRKKQGITQEQLSEKLQVSRQTISKWESGVSYAEMDKILQLCDLFSCDMDTLLRKNADESDVADNQKHRAHMKRFRTGTTSGIALLVGNMALNILLESFGVAEPVLNTLFMAIVIVGILILIVQGMEHERYTKKYPVIQDFYPEEEKEEFERSFIKRIAIGIGMILFGMLIGMNGENFPSYKGINEDFYNGIFLVFVTAAVSIIVDSGMHREEYDVEKYNKDNRPDQETRKKNQMLSVWCGCIMLIATIIFLVLGLVFLLWEICWIVYPVGGLLCGIAALIIKRN